jgi:hypothetical protein
LSQASGIRAQPSQFVADLGRGHPLSPARKWDDLRYGAVVLENFDFLACLHPAQDFSGVVPEITSGDSTHATTVALRLRS